MVVWVFLTFLLFNHTVEDWKMSPPFDTEEECNIMLEHFVDQIPDIILAAQADHNEVGLHEMGYTECTELDFEEDDEIKVEGLEI